MNYEGEIKDLKERVTELEKSLNESKAELKSLLDQIRLKTTEETLEASACADLSFSQTCVCPSHYFNPAGSPLQCAAFVEQGPHQGSRAAAVQRRALHYSSQKCP